MERLGTRKDCEKLAHDGREDLVFMVLGYYLTYSVASEQNKGDVAPKLTVEAPTVVEKREEDAVAASAEPKVEEQTKGNVEAAGKTTKQAEEAAVETKGEEAVAATAEPKVEEQTKGHVEVVEGAKAEAVETPKQAEEAVVDKRGNEDAVSAEPKVVKAKAEAVESPKQAEVAPTATDEHPNVADNAPKAVDKAPTAAHKHTLSSPYHKYTIICIS